MALPFHICNTLVLVTSLDLAAAAAWTQAATEWFVSPFGNDQWSGTLPTPNAARTDGPVATIKRAAELVRNRGHAGRKLPSTVNIAPGLYEQTSPWVLGARDGGDNEAAWVTWRGLTAGSDGTGPGVVVSFGIHLGNGTSPEARWTKVALRSATGKQINVWQRTLPKQTTDTGVRPRQMWDASTGKRMTRARTPNTGSNFIIPLDGALDKNVENSGFAYKDGDLNRAYANQSEVEVIVYASWSASRHYIKELNTSNLSRLTVTFTAGCRAPPAGMWPNSGNRYYLENDLTFVDEPGEYYISPSGVITFFPPEGIPDPNAHEWVVDRGDGLKTGLQLKDTSLAPPRVLVSNYLGGSPPIVLPASAMALSSDAFNLSFGLQVPFGVGGTIFVRGPTPLKHVPGDTTMAIVNGKIVLDFGWCCTLFGTSRVDDGELHQIFVTYANKQLRLLLDGKLDGSVSQSLSVETGETWLLTIGGSKHPLFVVTDETWLLTKGGWLPSGTVISNLTFSASSSQTVGYLTFENLAFEHVGWGLGYHETVDFQSASYLDTAAVHLHKTTEIQLYNVSVRHCGGYAVWIEGGSRSVSIQGADIDDVSGGVRIGRGRPLADEPLDGRTQHVSVHNSRITGGALVYREAAGVLVQNADTVSLTRSEVSFFNHVGVSFGWVWGFSPQAGRNNRIEFNRVHHVGNHDLSDLAGIYMLGVQPNTTVRGNIVHDSHPYFLYGHGIYLDEGASGIEVTQNWVYDTFAASYIQHYGVNNSVTSNVWARARGHCLTFQNIDKTFQTNCPGYFWYPAYRYQPCSFTFSSNILLSSGNQSSDATFWHQPAQGYCNVTSVRNLYWNASGAGLSPTFPSTKQPPCPSYACNLHSLNPNSTFTDWQSRGNELGSMVSNPQFVSAPTNNFNLASDSPALTLGFVPLDLTRGVGPDWERAASVSASVDVIRRFVLALLTLNSKATPSVRPEATVTS